MKKLLLIDGSSYLYRAFHAMPDLRNAKGFPTGALYGVINMLKRIQTDHPSDYSACIFDARGKTFRDDIYPEYKAQRPSMPDDLAQQIEPIHAAVKALGWPMIIQSGVEADDVIGTLAAHAQQKNIHTWVSTGDKDLAQLVNAQVTLVNTMSNEVLTPETVVEKFGVPPERIIDYLMLMGDNVDNIPGVAKVGPKTASKWLNEYGSIEGVIAAANQIKGVVGENLRLALPQFDLTRRLLTVKTDCALDAEILDFSALQPQPIDTDALLQIYEQYGFRTWLRELTQQPHRVPTGDARTVHAVTAPKVEQTHYQTITNLTQLQAWVERLKTASLVALDTETNGLQPMLSKLVGISFAIQAGEAAYLPLRHAGGFFTEQVPVEQALACLRPWLESADCPKLLHHAKFDQHILANEGIQLQGVQHDTLLQGYVLEAHKSLSMEALAERWLGRKGISFEELCGKGAKQITFDQVRVEDAAPYACEDADFTLQLHQVLYPQVQADAALLEIYQLEVACSAVLCAIERVGVAIDVTALHHQSHDLAKRLQQLEQQAYEYVGQAFNLASPKQLREILFDQLKLPVSKKTASGVPSTDEDVLTKLALDHPLPKWLLEHRSLAKLQSTYVEKLPRMVHPVTHRVHTSFAQAAVITGRLASSDPNLQNIPIRTPEGRKIREAFIASPGNVLVSADYSQIELRIMAHLSEDESLIRAFSQGEDVHRATASEVFNTPLDQVNTEQRRAAKVINFGLIYGMSEFGLAANLNIGRDEAKHYIQQYFARYPGVAQYMESTRQLAHSQGYVKTVFGRRLFLPEINSPNGPRRQAAERAAINAPMQGTAADLIKKAMVAVWQRLAEEQLASRIILQVHDELVLDVPQAELNRIQEILPATMANVAELRVPLLAEVGYGAHWDAAH